MNHSRARLKKGQLEGGIGIGPAKDATVLPSGLRRDVSEIELTGAGDHFYMRVNQGNLTHLEMRV